MNIDDLKGNSSELPGWEDVHLEARQLEAEANSARPDQSLRVGQTARIYDRVTGSWMTERISALKFVRCESEEADGETGVSIAGISWSALKMPNRFMYWQSETRWGRRGDLLQTW